MLNIIQGNECKCGNLDVLRAGTSRFDVNDMFTPAACKTKCSGNHQQTCGGNFALETYTFSCATEPVPAALIPSAPITTPPPVTSAPATSPDADIPSHSSWQKPHPPPGNPSGPGTANGRGRRGNVEGNDAYDERKGSYQHGGQRQQYPPQQDDGGEGSYQYGGQRQQYRPQQVDGSEGSYQHGGQRQP